MPTASLNPSILSRAAFQQAAEIKRRWRAGSAPDAAAVLDHAGLADLKSVVVDLAYEEYCLREQSGDAPDADQFCARFPRYRTSIRKVLDVHRLITDGLGQPADDSLAIGSWYEGLEVMGELGRGSFAKAYLAFDPQTDRPCVLKLSPGHSAEARVIGSLRHPHVTDAYWARQIDRMTAVCMPLMGISTLDDVRDAAFPSAAEPSASADLILAAIEPVSVDAPGGPPVVRSGEPYAVGVAAILGKIADALSYLHERGTSHGDLKPSNVVLGAGGHPYLIDFNLSASGSLPAGAVGGTLPYMAPEQLQRMLDAKAPTADPAKADVYAFGALAFELLTSAPPFVPKKNLKTATAADMLALLTAGDRAEPALPARTPEPLARVIRRCLALDSASRPTAAEIAKQLDAHLRLARGERRPRRRLRAALLVFGIAALAGTVWMVRPNPAPQLMAEKEPETAGDYFARGLQFLHRDQFSPAMIDFQTSYRLKPDPNMLAFTAYCTARSGLQNQAVEWGRQAIKAGVTSAAVQNNLGYSLLKSGSKSKEALQCLDEAVRLAPRLQAARCNRAWARYSIAIAPGGSGFDPIAAADIDAAKTRGPVTAALCFEGALYHAGGPEREPVFRYLAEAVALGKNPASFAHDPLFQKFSNDPEFQRILALKPGPNSPSPNLRLVEPDLP